MGRTVCYAVTLSLVILLFELRSYFGCPEKVVTLESRPEKIVVTEPCPVAARRIRTDVVMFVPTPVQWEERRRFVHDQFAKEGWRADQAVLLFVFGGAANVTVYPSAHNVVTGCRDMDYGQEYNSAEDTSSTTCKVYEAYKYVAQHYEARYVWRGADDSYVNLRYFMQQMPSLPGSRLFMGKLRRGDHIQDDLLLEKQPALRELYGLYQFGQYMYGMGFVMSFDVVEFIGAWTIPPHQTWCEDVMVGMWLNPFQISFTHHPGFHNQVSHAAQPGVDYMVVHYMRQEQWGRIGEDGRFIG